MKKLKKVILLVVFGVLLTACGKQQEVEEPVLIKIDTSATELIGQNYEVVLEELKQKGFTNIGVEELNDLVVGWLTKDGEVEEVIINGESDFEKDSEYPVDSKVLIVYHTFEEEPKVTNSESSASIEEELELFFDVAEEVQASADGQVVIKGTATPGATVSNGQGIIGDKTTADSNGNFEIHYELSTPKEVEITVNAKLNSQKKSVIVVILPDPVAVKKYEEEQIQESKEKEEVLRLKEEEKEKKSMEKDKSLELEKDQKKLENTPLTKENNTDFAAILEANDDYELYEEFVKEYKGRWVEFDGHIAYLSKHKSYDTRFDFLVYKDDYRVDGSGGAPFQFRNITYSELTLTGDNVPDSIGEGANIRIIAEVVEYNRDGGLILLKPKEIRMR